MKSDIYMHINENCNGNDIGSCKKNFHKNSKNQRRDQGILTASITVIAVLLFINEVSFKVYDTTFFFSIFAIIITIVIFNYSRKHEHKIEKVIADTLKIIQRHDKGLNRQKQPLLCQIHELLQDILDGMSKIEKLELDEVHKQQKSLTDTYINLQFYSNDSDLKQILDDFQNTSAWYNVDKSRNIETSKYRNNLKDQIKNYLDKLDEKLYKLPIIETDKGEYSLGDYMIVTVIDSAVNTNNQHTEYIGDQENSKFTITSKYMKGEDYRLKRIKSTENLFQMYVDIRPVQIKDYVSTHKYNNTSLSKTQGIDGEWYVECNRGDDLTLEYTSKGRYVKQTIFVLDVPPIIEFDKQVYRPDDTVSVTLVLPEFDLDFEKITKINDQARCFIDIWTDIDNKKLETIEISPESEVFSAEIKLTKINSKTTLHEIRNTNDVLFYGNNGYVKALFKIFDSEKITCASQICKN